MELSESYLEFVPDEILRRYDWVETRNAAAILRATNSEQFAQIMEVLDGFRLEEVRDIIQAGGNESAGPILLNTGFRERGWREGDYNQTLTSQLRLKPYAAAGETHPVVEETIVTSPSYLVDNIRGRVALDVEWHAKDGNLDRDIAAYRALYEAGIIDVAVMVTTKREDLRAWVLRLDPESKKWGTSTTTNLTKVTPRLTRGDGGGCPILVAAIGERTV